MTDSNYTAVVLVVDRSGSIASIRSDLEGGLNEMIENQKLVPGKCTLDLVLFDTHYEDVYSFASLDDVKVSIVPRGSTALNDAIGRKINSFGEALARMDEDKRPGKVIFVVATDGFENASREYSGEAIKTLVTEQTEKYGWEFVFLGANQDAVLVGGSLGFHAGNTMTYRASSAGVRNTTDSLNTYMTATRSGLDYEFTEADRVNATEG